MKKLFAGKFNFTGFCVALLATWIALNGFAQAAPDSIQVVSVIKADGTKAVHLLEKKGSMAFAVKDGQVSDLLSIEPPDSQKLIIKFKEKPHLGGPAVFPSAKVIGGYDCYNNDNDPMDDHYHGTHVAGIVAANGGLKGVAYEASLMAYKVLSGSGSGSFSTVVQGIELSTDPDRHPATDDGADVINMSSGGSGNPDDPVSQAVDNAVDSGAVTVVAAWNRSSYSKILSPGVARKALTVGASDKADRLASFSSKGPVSEDFSIKPDVTAPGVQITSSQIGGGTRVLNGTSMAAPHVAGAAALQLQSNPGLSPQDVKHILMGTAVDIGYDDDVFSQGSGRVDVYKAIRSHTPLPEGIDVSVPDTVTLDPLTGADSFEFNISVVLYFQKPVKLLILMKEYCLFQT